MQNVQRAWDVQTRGGKPIRKTWLRESSTVNLLDLLELGAVIEADRQIEGDVRADAPKYVQQSIGRIREELMRRSPNYR